MQAKKRAKPVKFGRPPEKKHETGESIDEREVAGEAVGPTVEEENVIEEQAASEPEPTEREVVQRDEHIKEDLTFRQKEPDITYSQTREENIRTQELRDNRPESEQNDLDEKMSGTSSMPESHASDIRDDERVDSVRNEQISKDPENTDDKRGQAIETEQQQDQPEQADQQDSYTSLGGDTYIVEKEVRSGMLGYFFLIAIVAFLIGIASMAAANFYLLNSKPVFNLPFIGASATPTPTIEPTKPPTPTPAAVDKSEFEINILNGSGITGAAAKLESSLEAEGYNVVSRGNADNSDYTETVIQAGKTVSDSYLDELTEFLGESYSVSSEIETASGSAADADLTIIIGSKPAASN